MDFAIPEYFLRSSELLYALLVIAIHTLFYFSMSFPFIFNSYDIQLFYVAIGLYRLFISAFLYFKMDSHHRFSKIQMVDGVSSFSLFEGLFVSENKKKVFYKPIA